MFLLYTNPDCNRLFKRSCHQPAGPVGTNLQRPQHRRPVPLRSRIRKLLLLVVQLKKPDVSIWARTREARQCRVRARSHPEARNGKRRVVGCDCADRSWPLFLSEHGRASSTLPSRSVPRKNILVVILAQTAFAPTIPVTRTRPRPIGRSRPIPSIVRDVLRAFGHL